MIIGLTGVAGSGKSTVAQYLAETHHFQRARFAGPLKNMMRSLYASAGLNDTEIERRIEGDLKEIPDDILCGSTPRYAMQTLGTEWRDLIGRDLWSRIWESSLKGLAVVAEDCRFEHEYDLIRSKNGFVVQVVRGESVGGSHASENGLPKRCAVDYVLDNTGTIEQLHASIQDMLIALQP